MVLRVRIADWLPFALAILEDLRRIGYTIDEEDTTTIIQEALRVEIYEAQ